TSREFIHHLQEIDRVLFKVLFEGYERWEGLKNLGLSDSTYFIITADHGGFPIQAKSELIQDLKKLPLRMKNKQASQKVLKQCNLLVAYTDGFANLYVRNPSTKNWKDKVDYSQIIAYPTSNGAINLIKLLLKIPTVSHLFIMNRELKSPTYQVFTRDGASQIQRKIENKKTLISYQVLSGNDPFDYSGKPKIDQLIGGAYHPFDEWFRVLSDTNYPVMLDQIPRIFDCETGGDILMMGKEGYSFSKQRKKGTHDTGTAICTRVPLIIAGPSIKHITIPIARTVDIVPTLLYLLNKTTNFSQFDGRILTEIIKS
ncbi:MAG: hypothetical protein HWN66_15550, partial [Candidatus Helarchaeota archaeon]|nr:hypothetical protein [Candidatus Helarchaeota archaeon]